MIRYPLTGVSESRWLIGAESDGAVWLVVCQCSIRCCSWPQGMVLDMLNLFYFSLSYLTWNSVALLKKTKTCFCSYIDFLKMCISPCCDSIPEVHTQGCSICFLCHFTFFLRLVFLGIFFDILLQGKEKKLLGLFFFLFFFILNVRPQCLKPNRR